MRLIATRSSLLKVRESFSRYRTYSSAIDPSPIRVVNHPAPHSGNIRILLLNTPENRNALSRRLVADLKSHIDEVQAESESGKGGTRVLVIASNVDKAFCAGADLKERRSMSQDESFLLAYEKLFTDLSNLNIPTISAISSIALGGGLELGLCTTFRVFASSATVGLPETRLAIIPGAGGTYRLPALLGPNIAKDLILTGRRVSGTEAYFLGLCNRLVEITPEDDAIEGGAREKVLDASLHLARNICEGGPIALGQAMRAVNGWQRGEISEGEAYEVIMKTEDRLEALDAFAEKRKPVFKGR